MPPRPLAIALTLLALALCPAIALADDGYLGVAGSSVMPLQNTQVRMAAEHVTAEIRGDEAWVTCVFTFTNSGPATKVLMGFPQLKPGELGRDSNYTELHDFTANVGGRALPVEYRVQATPTPAPTRRPATRAPTVVHALPTAMDDDRQWWAGRYMGWHTFTVPFAAGQTRVVTNTYHGPLGGTSIGDHFFEYELATGATWQGSIGDAIVEVNWRNDREAVPSSVGGHPDGFVVGERSLRWHFTDLEPNREANIMMHFMPAFGPPTWGELSTSSGRFVGADDGVVDGKQAVADEDPDTAWLADNAAPGARLAWSAGGSVHYLVNDGKVSDVMPRGDSSLGVGFLPGLAGRRHTAHGRPKDVRVRLASLRDDLSRLPASLPSATIFDQPPSGVFVTERRLKLPDEQRWTYVVPDVGRPIVGFEITVESVYPGTRYDDVAIADVRFPADPDELAAAGLALPPTPAPPGRLDEPWRMIVPPAGRGADIGARTMRAAWREPAPAHGPVSRRRSMETSIPNPPTYLNIEPKK